MYKQEIAAVLSLLVVDRYMAVGNCVIVVEKGVPVYTLASMLCGAKHI